MNSIENIYLFILPKYENYPKIAFLISLIISCLHSKLIVYLVENISILTKISASFFGMSLISWAGNIGDCINASVAAKMNNVDLLTTGILASQIMNLQICLGIPWIIYMINSELKDNSKLFINFGKEKINNIFLPTLATAFSSVFVMFLFKRRLNRISGFILFIIYIIYFIYSFINNKN
jgi:Ca2+/Na+ antiporter